jgi:DNA-binding transcriptional LysR family regulator
MQQEHDKFMATAPFDLYELHLLQLLAKEGNFTRAAAKAGLTQSAMTRQIAGMESALGVRLFDRTTRSVTLTPAGALLVERAGVILKHVATTLEELHQGLGLLPKTLTIGVSRSIGFAYLPGFLFRFQREAPNVQINLVQESSRRLLELLDSRELDVAVICSGPRLPRGVQVAHRFVDEFTLILPHSASLTVKPRLKLKELSRMLRNQRWLMIDRKSTTGALLHDWLEDHGFDCAPAMEVNNFDLIINMVALGLGASIVPHRALPLYLQRRRLQKIPLRPRFARELAVVTRKSNYPRPHVEQFVKSILF